MYVAPGKHIGSSSSSSISPLKLFIQKREINTLWWYAFFMSFPVIVILQNISVFIFPFMLVEFRKRFGYYFTFRHISQFAAGCFAIGAILSVSNIADQSASFSRALSVLPNYLYWAALIIFFVSHYKNILLPWVYKAITVGLFLLIFYHFVLLRAGIASFGVFKTTTPNAFAFILITFSPIATYYIKRKHGFMWGLVAVIGFTLMGFFSGSRSGALLTLGGSTLAFFSNYLRFNRTVIIVIVCIAGGYMSLQSTVARTIVHSLNPRVYDLLYDTEMVRLKDPSYLIRLAMIEKALEIHKKHPYHGIGLNNFAEYKIKTRGDFKGSKLVMYKVSKEQFSSHNSYTGVLAEGGLFLFVPFIFLLAWPILFFLWRFNKILESHKPIFIALIMMAIHIYFIFSIVNVFTWFLIALANALATTRNQNA